jgi:hypothetical protein
MIIPRGDGVLTIVRHVRIRSGLNGMSLVA